MTAVSRTDDCVSTGVLTERGWTPAAIRRFLGDPDRTAPNPIYRSAAPMRLFSLARAVAAARVGRDAATDAIRERVYAAIADAYPALADEVRRQPAERQAGL